MSYSDLISDGGMNPRKETNMQQLELKFFWPLQEQMALDLDDHLISKAWTVTDRTIDRGCLFISSNISGGSTYIDIGEVVFRTKKPQSRIQRLLFKLLGLRVENVDD